ncbi:hypothetical protein OPV22_001343 [Ensete ventricosum]|uniref:BHLH domain-containing protein n=1 Tax=Ensete ventricosum TaxID=4639 RepID=A0AAV8RWA7_ENSVE|nr:hypothetical protein OPV22_001343 [Ensete ventricosum]
MADHQLRAGSSGSWWSAASLAMPFPEVADVGGSFRWATAADMDVFEAQSISNPHVSSPAAVGFGLSSPSLEWSQPFFCSSSSNGERDDTGLSFHGLLQEEVISRPCVQRDSGIEDSSWSPLKTMNQSFMHDHHRHHHVLSSNASCELPSSTLLPGLLEPDSRLQRSFHGHHEQLQRSASAQSPRFSNETCFWNPSAGDGSNPMVKTTAGAIRSSCSAMEKRNSSEPAPKKARTDTPSPLPTFKVRKEKLGDRITALQQLVSPFGKTDTASVLQEAIEYIKFLHDQVRVLSAPYLKNGHQMQQVKSLDSSKDSGEQNQDLRSRGLCLVPMSSTFAVANEIPADLWTPSFIGTFR